MNLPGCLCLFDCSEVCKKDPECDYYFSIDSDVALTNPDILRILMEENKYVEALFTPSVKPWAHLHWMRLSKTKKTTKKCRIFVKFLKTDSQIFKCFRPTRVSLWRFSLWSGLLHGDWSRIDHFRFPFCDVWFIFAVFLLAYDGICVQTITPRSNSAFLNSSDTNRELRPHFASMFIAGSTPNQDTIPSSNTDLFQLRH